MLSAPLALDKVVCLFVSMVSPPYKKGPSRFSEKQNKKLRIIVAVVDKPARKNQARPTIRLMTMRKSSASPT